MSDTLPPLGRRTLLSTGAAAGLATLAPAGAARAAAPASPFRTLDASATAISHLLANPRPVFAAGTRLPRLLRFDWGAPLDADMELAKNWFYQLSAPSDYNLVSTWGFSDEHAEHMRLAATYPNDFKLAVSTISYGVYFNNPRPENLSRLPAATYLHDAKGKLPVDADGNPIYAMSPLCPDSALRLAGGDINWVLRKVQAIAPINMIYDRGEWGMNSIYFGSALYTGDPKVQAAVSRYGDAGRYDTWWNYLSTVSANQHRRLRGYSTAGLPTGIPYCYYTNGFGGDRGRWYGWKGDIWNYAKIKGAFGTWPSSEGYFRRGNDGYVGFHDGGAIVWDMLTLQLNAVSGQIANGNPLSYNWHSAGWDDTEPSGYVSDPDLYMGFLKCMYTAGQIGMVQNYFTYNRAQLQGGPVGAQPNAWVWGWMVASHAHALFAKLQNFLFSGDLLPGPNVHAYSGYWDPPGGRPAYEFPCEGETRVVQSTWEGPVTLPTARVLARKLRASSQYLVTAWVPEGADRDVRVTLPEIGGITLRARRAGAVYVIKRNAGGGWSTIQQDANAMFPTAK